METFEISIHTIEHRIQKRWMNLNSWVRRHHYINPQPYRLSLFLLDRISDLTYHDTRNVKSESSTGDYISSLLPSNTFMQRITLSYPTGPISEQVSVEHHYYE